MQNSGCGHAWRGIREWGGEEPTERARDLHRGLGLQRQGDFQVSILLLCPTYYIVCFLSCVCQVTHNKYFYQFPIENMFNNKKHFVASSCLCFLSFLPTV